MDIIIFKYNYVFQLGSDHEPNIKQNPTRISNKILLIKILFRALFKPKAFIKASFIKYKKYNVKSANECDDILSNGDDDNAACEV